MKFIGYVLSRNSCWKSFGKKIFIVFIAVITLVSAAFTYLSVYSESKDMKEGLAREGVLLATLLAHNVRTGVFAENREMLRDTVAGVMDQKHVVAVSVHTSGLRPLLVEEKKVTAKRGTGAGELDRDRVRNLKDMQALEVVETGGTIRFMKPVVIETFPSAEALFFGNDGKAGSKKVIGYISVILDKTAVERGIRAILLKHLAVTLMFVLVGSVLVYIAVRRVITPLERLTASVKMLGLGETIGIVPVESEDEVGKLAEAFNVMSENLQKREGEKTALEERLSHAKKMEAVSGFARGIAHDFNNLLTTVHGSVFLLQNKIDAGSPLQNYLSKMSTTLARTRELTDILLTYGRGQYTHPEKVSINRMLEKMGPVMSCVTGDTVEYRACFSPEPLMVLADRVQLEQVLMNLAHNARDAMPGGGVLSITTGTAVIGAGEGPENIHKISGKVPGEYVLITVEDTGSGMEDAVRERIFEPFFSTKEQGKGTGLGLYIVYSIIDQYGGYIDVGQRGGEGTVFSIYLPRAAAEELQ